jgi:long-chain acyl-CoA synthetase
MGKSGMNIKYQTLPALLKYVEQNFQNECCFGFKENNIWQKIPTQKVGDTVRQICLGLMELGLKPGDKVGLVADASPFWILMDLAVLAAGGITVPMFSNISAENLEFEIKDSGMRFLFLGSAQQYMAMQPFFGSLEKLVTLENHSHDKAISFKDLAQLGSERQLKNPNEYEASAMRIQPSDTATLIYTSGSTGVPKGVELTHQNLVSQVAVTHERFPLDPAVDVILSCLPLAHIFERMVAYFYFSTGCPLYFAEDIKKVADNLREVKPTIITMVPRLLEKVFAKMQGNIEAASGFKKKLGTLALQGAKFLDPLRKKTWKDFLFDKLVYSKMRQALGGRLRIIISGSAPLDPAINKFFINIGLEVYEGYGLTEASPVISANYPGNRKIGTVGKAFPGVEVRISDDGEILAKGPNIMKGYFNQPTETAQAIDTHGWLHTGDLGFIDVEGYIKITGRKKELFKTANGKYVAPVPIEQAIAKNKLVDMVMVIAEGKPYTTCLIFPDFENMTLLKQELAEENISTEIFLKSKAALDFIQKTIDQVNAKLNHWEQVQKFIIIPNLVTIDSGQLTPTMKLRRHVVMEKYKVEIDSMYKS